MTANAQRTPCCSSKVRRSASAIVAAFAASSVLSDVDGIVDTVPLAMAKSDHIWSGAKRDGAKLLPIVDAGWTRSGFVRFTKVAVVIATPPTIAVTTKISFRRLSVFRRTCFQLLHIT